MVNAILALTAVLCAGVFGWFLWKALEQKLRRSKHKELVIGNRSGGAESLDEKIFGFLERESRNAEIGQGKSLPKFASKSVWFTKHCLFAGLEGRVTEQGFCRARLKLALLGAAIGFVLGLSLSGMLAVLLAFVGGCVGWRVPTQMIKHRIECRSQEMEQHLSEMLDVISIGMRSGLSFDRSLQIYYTRFDTLLAREFELAQCKWSSGLENRDAALRNIAASYNSVVFSRVAESIIRSLRFGSSMVEGLEAASIEARTAYRTRRQEQVAKAPVKMMVPTGTLILPAMLVMVLGPVLLEMMGGGI